MTIVEKIRVLANQQKMSLPDLEVKLGLGNGTISRWNKNKPNTDKLTLVADYFDVSVDYLLGRVKDKNEIIDNDNTKQPASLDDMIKIYTRGKNKLTPEEKIRLAQIILADRNDK